MSIMSGHFDDFWRTRVVVALFSLLAKLLGAADTYHVMAAALRSHLLPILAYSRAPLRHFQDLLPDYFTAFQDLIMVDITEVTSRSFHKGVYSCSLYPLGLTLMDGYTQEGYSANYAL